MIIMAETEEELKQHLATAMTTLVSLGFVITLRKSLLIPGQELEILGFLLDTKRMTIALPQKKLHALMREARKMMNQEETTVTRIGSLAGHDGGCPSGNTLGPIALSEPGESKIKHLAKRRLIRLDSEVESGLEVRLVMVDNQPDWEQWKDPPDSTMGPHYRVGCLRG